MKFKEYEMPDGKKAVFEYDENGVGKITLECMDMLMGLINDRKTESNSEKPNSCDTCRFELYCPEMCEGCCEWDSHYEPKDEVTISKMEQVEDEPQINCDTCRFEDCSPSKEPCNSCIVDDSNWQPKDEPQYDAEEAAKDINRRVDMVKKEWNARHMDEPQTERSE